MDNRSKNSSYKSNRKDLHKNEKKFSILSCPVTESYCHNILDEINELYAESELARINKEYLKSVSFLEEAFRKTNELNHKSCIVCADLFKHHIYKTIEAMKEELYEISHGVFSTNNYKLAYSRLCNWEIK